MIIQDQRQYIGNDKHQTACEYDFGNDVGFLEHQEHKQSGRRNHGCQPERIHQQKTIREIGKQHDLKTVKHSKSQNAQQQTTRKWVGFWKFMFKVQKIEHKPDVAANVGNISQLVDIKIKLRDAAFLIEVDEPWQPIGIIQCNAQQIKAIYKKTFVFTDEKIY
ncbi:MAG: hypothetical protein WBF83_11135 [Moheibacter sp.]